MDNLPVFTISNTMTTDFQVENPSQGVTILGSTGSIGVSTLDVIARHSDKYHVSGLSANKNVATLFAQCQQFKPKKVVMTDPQSADQLQNRIAASGLEVEVLCGEQALSDVSAGSGDTVVCGIVGAVGLMSTLAAVKSGKKVLVANKEPLVMLGEHIMQLARQSGARLLPLDSEHNAIFQCLPQQILAANHGNVEIDPTYGVKSILLTGSGGPFRQLALEKFPQVTPEQACAHPNWQMGKKISVDSATMMNKGLELIEACPLFGISADMIEIVVHPQSVIHSMVEYTDGSILAQMGNPDMRIPIASALAWPNRIESGVESLDFKQIGRFDFEAPDFDRFPALRLAQYAASSGGTLPAIMNAANEVAVESFLAGRLSFDKIPVVVEIVMGRNHVSSVVDLESVLIADAEARRESENVVYSLSR
jgi:1-deoxy-D-xylulose-5-phosphate reductoisomerase